MVIFLLLAFLAGILAYKYAGLALFFSLWALGWNDRRRARKAMGGARHFCGSGEFEAEGHRYQCRKCEIKI